MLREEDVLATKKCVRQGQQKSKATITGLSGVCPLEKLGGAEISLLVIEDLCPRMELRILEFHLVRASAIRPVMDTIPAPLTIPSRIKLGILLKYCVSHIIYNQCPSFFSFRRPA